MKRGVLVVLFLALLPLLIPSCWVLGSASSSRKIPNDTSSHFEVSFRENGKNTGRPFWIQALILELYNKHYMIHVIILKEENLIYFHGSEEAKASWGRVCKSCKPEEEFHYF